MPTFPLGKTLSYYLGGYNFSGISNGYDSELSIEALDATCFGPSLHKAQAPGLMEAKISTKGLYTNETDYPEQTVLLAALRAEVVGTVVLPGSGTTPAAGDEAELWISTGLTRKLGVAVDSLTTVDAEFSSQTGLHLGEALTAETAFSGAPFSSTGYDQGGAGWSSTSRRYLVVLQVTAYTSGLAAVLVQTSTDNSSWTTRGTFPAITGIGGYALALTTTLDRYIRIRDTGVATILPAFALTY